MGHLKDYAASATEEGGWQRYFDQYVKGDEASYAASVGGETKIRTLPLPIF